KFGFEETPLLVYDAAADVRVPLFAAADAATGVQTLAGSVEFQACNDQVCLAPAMVPFTVQVTVAPGVPGAVSHAPAAADTGGLFGSALQSLWVNLVLGGIMLVLALGMFGMYEMQPPSWVMDRLGGAQATNFAGAFVSGLGVGIIAAPCVGPFVVAVLALIAQKGDVGFGVRTMFTLSLGLGSPYLFLATFSNLLQALPRSGAWMLWVKH